jgi:hypothetical protein
MEKVQKPSNSESLLYYEWFILSSEAWKKSGQPVAFDSNLGRNIAYHEREVSWNSSVPPGKCRNSYLKLGNYRYLLHPYPFMIHHHPIICCYVVWVNDGAVKWAASKLNMNEKRQRQGCSTKPAATGFLPRNMWSLTANRNEASQWRAQVCVYNPPSPLLPNIHCYKSEVMNGQYGSKIK